MYYVQGVGYVSGQFEKDGVRYPFKWLQDMSDEELTAFGAEKMPVFDEATHVLEQNPDGWLVRDKTQQELDDYAEYLARAQESIKQNKISVLWEEANAHANEIDENSRTSILWLNNEDGAPQWRLDRIAEIKTWWDNIWRYYKTLKDQIIAGQDVVYNRNVAGDPPYNIWDLLEE